MAALQNIQSLRGDALWKGGFPLRVVRYDHRRNRRMHQHDFFELVLVTSGHARHVTPNGSCDISEGDVFLIRPGTAHAYEAVSDFSLVNLIYAPQLLPLCDLAKSPGYQALFVLEPEQWLPGGGFRHLMDDADVDGMATEQGYYALAAYYRLTAGKTSLYDMSDVTITVTPDQPAKPDAPRTGDESPVLVWMGMAALAGAAVLLMQKKKKRA